MNKAPTEIDSWNMLKTVMKTDLEYFKEQEAKILVQQGDENTIKVLLSITGSSVGIIEYYIEVMQQIESGELSANGGKESR